MKNPLIIISILLSNLLFSQHTLSEGNKWQGVAFPEFELLDQHKAIKNNANFSNQWVVYFFYPKDRTPGCTEEAKNFVDDYSQFNTLKTAIVGISYDDSESHKDFADIYEMQFTLLADVDKKLTKALGVDRLLPLPHPSRESFLVNPEGVIVKHYKDVDPSVHSAELLRDIKAMQKK